jgi:hypothetical protein
LQVLFKLLNVDSGQDPRRQVVLMEIQPHAYNKKNTYLRRQRSH